MTTEQEQTQENKKAKVVKIINSVIDKVGQNQQVSLNSIMMEPLITTSCENISVLTSLRVLTNDLL